MKSLRGASDVLAALGSPGSPSELSETSPGNLWELSVRSVGGVWEGQLWALQRLLKGLGSNYCNASELKRKSSIERSMLQRGFGSRCHQVM